MQKFWPQLLCCSVMCIWGDKPGILYAKSAAKPRPSLSPGLHPETVLRHSCNARTQCIPAGTAFFAKMEAIHGYFQLALDEESSTLTTFLLPSGRIKVLQGSDGTQFIFTIQIRFCKGYHSLRRLWMTFWYGLQICLHLLTGSR